LRNGLNEALVTGCRLRASGRSAAALRQSEKAQRFRCYTGLGGSGEATAMEIGRCVLH
jgi:hypothetical protein